MTTKTVTIGKDGSLVITKSDDDAPPATGAAPVTVETKHHHSDGFDGGAFFAGIFLGALTLWLLQVWRRAAKRRRLERLAAATAPDTAKVQSEMEALARRTATLERIVTDPAHRVASEIEALR